MRFLRRLTIRRHPPHPDHLGLMGDAGTARATSLWGGVIVVT
jgi:hypothetical protein